MRVSAHLARSAGGPASRAGVDSVPRADPMSRHGKQRFITAEEVKIAFDEWPNESVIYHGSPRPGRLKYYSQSLSGGPQRSARERSGRDEDVDGQARGEDTGSASTVPKAIVNSPSSTMLKT